MSRVLQASSLLGVLFGAYITFADIEKERKKKRFSDNVFPSLPQRRIDRLAETGLELMMTEFDIGWPDDLERADWLEDAIRAFFGHPKMRGVILWDFWNQTMNFQDHELVSGPDQSHLTVCM